jgi:uncharacterized membrane protein
VIIRSQGEHSKLAAAVKGDLKGKVSPVIYAIAIGLAFVHPIISQSLYALVALIWLVPDRRLEHAQAKH